MNNSKAIIGCKTRSSCTNQCHRFFDDEYNTLRYLQNLVTFRSRASAQGIAAAWNYIVTFFAAKSYIDLEMHVKLWGTFAVYAGFAYAGTIYLYFFMPETEGIPLAEIENFYKGSLRTFANDPFINFFRRIFRIKH